MLCIQPAFSLYMKFIVSTTAAVAYSGNLYRERLWCTLTFSQNKWFVLNARTTQEKNHIIPLRRSGQRCVYKTLALHTIYTFFVLVNDRYGSSYLSLNNEEYDNINFLEI